MSKATRCRAALGYLSIVAGLQVAGSAAASDLNGFLCEKRQGNVALSFTSQSYDEFWAGKTSVAPPEVGQVDTTSISLWLSYGITDDLTLIASLPFVDADSDGTMGFEASDLQDVTLLGAYRLLEKNSSVRHDLVGALGLRVPAGYDVEDPGVSALNVGDGTTDGLLRVVYLLRVGGFYGAQQVGYEVRGEDAPDGWPLYTELGYTMGRTTVSGFYQKLVASDGTDIMGPGFDSFPENQEEYDRAGAKVYVRIGDRFGLAASVFDTLDGRNTGDATGVSVGTVLGF